MKRWLRTFRYAGQGLWHTFCNERNMRFHVAAAAAAVIMGAYAGLDRLEWLWIVLAIALVWSAECMNTAVERAVDLAAGDERMPLAKFAKDTAAAAVFIMAVFALVVAAMVLFPALLEKVLG